LPNINGQYAKLSWLKGSYVLVYFWATFVPLYKDHFVTLNNILNRYKDKGLQIFAVAIQGDAVAWTQTIRTEQLSWVNVLEQNENWTHSPIFETYNLRELPYVVLVTPDGKIAGRSSFAQVELLIKGAIK
jgi:hypothetical protein